MTEQYVLILIRLAIARALLMIPPYNRTEAADEAVSAAELVAV